MRLLFLILFLVVLPYDAVAQLNLFDGTLSGGIESNFALYTDGSYGSNNYLKMDYVKGKFSAGLQIEYYPTPMLGYAPGLKGVGFTGKYLSWNADTWSVAIGDFYEQFGTGLTLRSWEDRNLGWNNSLGGGRVTLQSKNGLFSTKLLFGFPRENLSYSSSKVAGSEVTFQFNGITLSGSVVDRIYHGENDLSGSALFQYDKGGFSGKAEYVIKKGGGNAQTLSLNYASKKISTSLTLRRVKKMTDRLGMNYIPSLSQEQTYMLASLNPYMSFTEGEIGGAADLFLSLKKWKIHLNGSMIFALPSALANYDHCRLAYRDLNIDAERRWSNRFKMTFFVSIQEMSPSYGDRKATNAQNVFVVDGIYRFNKKTSLRVQVQYLYSQELTRDWMAGLVELGFSPHWNIHISDMFNHGDTKVHYYEGGISYTYSTFKGTLSYGHQRSGYICSGGVCRWQPEYTGFLARLNYNF